jgi:recombination protein RecR
MFSPSIDKLIKLFAKFPTVGPKTAARFVFYLINSPKSQAQQLVSAIADLKNKIKTCQLCQRAFEPQEPNSLQCAICFNPKRHNGQVCLVEKEIDLETIEKTNSFKGIYFVLGSNLSPLKEIQRSLENELKILLQLLEAENISEVILALNPTTEGQHTALWLKRQLGGSGVKITQLGLGLPLGGELEYADEQTLSSALDNRKQMC